MDKAHVPGIVRVRLRPQPSLEELERLYATPHQHTRWLDHRIRVDVTAVLALHLLGEGKVVADLSCGDATIAKRLAAINPYLRLILGDFAPGYEHQGPIEETLQAISSVDLWILSETLEHLDDPDAVLTALRARTRHLILSTPDGETDDSNPEHLWAWDSEEVRKMLCGVGFTPLMHTQLDLRPAGFAYCYQIWGCG